MIRALWGRRLVLWTVAVAATLVGGAQTGAQQVATPPLASPPASAQGRILARRAASSAAVAGSAAPAAPAERAPARRPPEARPPGLHALSVDTGRDVLLYVPAGYRADRPTPLLVMLHGAGGTPRGGLSWVMSRADSAGVILVAPKSLGVTWDVIRGRYGADVALVDSALAHVLAHYNVDTTRLAIGGFSDGATYALSVGITNGDLFTHVIAFSPGFMVPAGQRGEPRLFVSHGTQDRILSIEACSRRIVRRVRDAGYDVVYREFEGGHTVPPQIAREALAWLGRDVKRAGR